MGAFYESILLKAETNDEIRKVLDQIVGETGASFYLGPALDGWVSVFPDFSSAAELILQRMAEATKADLFYLTVHDDDFFTYDFYRSGRLLDTYNSCPEYFQTDPEEVEKLKGTASGNPETFQNLLPNPADFARLRKLLDASHDKYIFEGQRLEEFAGLIGLTNAVGSYEYFQAGEGDELASADQYIHLKGAGIQTLPEAAPTALGFLDMARALRSEGHLSAALVVLDQAILSDPELAAAYNVRGLTRMETGDVAGAVADYDRAIELKPDYSLAFANRGEFRRRQGDWAGALADLNRAIELEPKSESAYNNRARVKQSLRDFSGALADFDRAIELKPDSATILNNRGEVKRLRGDFAGARLDYDRAIALDPARAAAFSNRGLLCQAQGDLAGALADFNRALEIEPVAIAFNNRALLMHAKGDLAAARADLDQAIKLKPDEAEFFRNRGQIRLLSGDLDGGLADAEQALGLRPDWVEACNLLAEIQRKKGDLDRALENFGRVIAKTPAFGPAYNGRGLAKFARGEYAEALADLDAAVRLLPNVPLVYNNRSTILQAMGELDRAHTDCLKALELKPDFADAKKRLTVLFDLIVNRSVEAAAANAVGADGTDASVPGAPAVRTDFSNEKRWRALCSAVKKGDNDLGAEASVEFVSDKKYEGWTPAELLKVYDDVPNASFLLVIDTKAIQSQGYPILVVNLKEEPGRRFRVSASDLWMVENNLSIGNMDFSEFVDHLDEDGVFRGFPG